jgi:hypothetical protein
MTAIAIPAPIKTPAVIKYNLFFKNQSFEPKDGLDPVVPTGVVVVPTGVVVVDIVFISSKKNKNLRNLR